MTRKRVTVSVAVTPTMRPSAALGVDRAQAIEWPARTRRSLAQAMSTR